MIDRAVTPLPKVSVLTLLLVASVEVMIAPVEVANFNQLVVSAGVDFEGSRAAANEENAATGLVDRGNLIDQRHAGRRRGDFVGIGRARELVSRSARGGVQENIDLAGVPRDLLEVNERMSRWNGIY